MTVPTQAQIEAIRQKLWSSSCFRDVCQMLPCQCAEEIAAITAAAEVGYSEPQGTGFQAGEAEPAAAEAGEPSASGLLRANDETWTQAQIEAALIAYSAHSDDSSHKAAIIRALTAAAAEAGDKYGPSETEAKAIMAEAAALAEIEELKEKLAATIERCAQVAWEQLWRDHRGIAEKVVTALRALKEQP